MLEFSPDPVVADNQMKAIIFMLVAFGTIDSHFDPVEKDFVRAHIGKLIAHRTSAMRTDEAQRAAETKRWTEHYWHVLDEVDRSVQRHFTESVNQGETTQQFVLSRLKLGCFELLKYFDEPRQQALLGTIDELIRADGVVHPEEQSFRDELVHLLKLPEELSDADLVDVTAGDIIVDAAQKLEAKQNDHPLLLQSEWDYAVDPVLFAQQAEGDMELVGRVMGTMAWQRSQGQGKLDQYWDMTAYAHGGPGAEGDLFLDGHVYVLPAKANREVELLVVGDLHGCYSCLKAALLQADFFTKMDAYERDPKGQPFPALVMLGDYIDRGRFSYSGTLRAAMQLYHKWPGHVFMLRGNHEYYIEHKGRVLAPVRPAEAMESIASVARMDVFSRYMKLFDSLPNILIFDRMMFVHAGIPRDATFKAKWRGPGSLNDPDMRFEMMWSDPSQTDVVPAELQKESARFAFGRKQFQYFMGQVGCRTMFRGHERVTEGFRTSFDGPEGTLFTVFSAGGATNEDLPEDSSYREVTPLAVTIRHRDGQSKVTPLVLDYARFNDPKHNAFFKSKLGPTS